MAILGRQRAPSVDVLSGYAKEQFMKLRIAVSVLSLSIFGLWACQEQQPGEPAADQQKPADGTAAATPAGGTVAQPTPPPAAETPKPPEVTPKEVCDQAVAAAKEKDAAKLAALCAGDVSATGDQLVGLLAKGTCGEAALEGDKAQIPVAMGAGKKAKSIQVPLTKGVDGWKIDAAALLEKHPGKKAKKGKKKKGK
jgi:hypothetical protein